MTEPDSNTDIAGLTEEQQLALQQFTSVTDQDLAAAVPLLRKCEWNVQIAIARFFDGEPPEPTHEEPSNVPPPQSTRTHDTLANGFSTSRRSTSSSSSRRPLEPAPRVSSHSDGRMTQSPPFILSLFLTPANLLYRLVARVFNLISYLFPFLPRLISRLIPRVAGGPSQRSATMRRPLGPQDTTLRFLREFEEDYGSHSLPFLETGYTRAFDLAKRDLKFLLAIPLAPEHDDTAPFVRQVLLSSPVSTYLNNPENNVLLWAGSIQDSEPYQVAESLAITKFPCAVLIALTPSVSSTAMSVIARISGLTTPEDFIARVQASVTQHAAELDRARSSRAEQDAARNLREQQNSAYERSLAQDRERARQRRETEAAKAQEEKIRREAEEAAARYVENLANWRRWRASKLPPEPAADDVAGKGAVRLSLRMPDGERAMRRIRPDADLEEVYALVECWDLVREREQGEGSSDEKAPIAPPSGFDHKYGFRLVSPMPREVYDLGSGGTVRERIGRSGNLIVEKIEEEETDEDA